jgi:3-deoxy-7-phosphoheptulonate synthase
MEWTPDSWQACESEQGISYPDRGALDEAVATLRRLPPLVTSWEIERLKALIADAQIGNQLLLHGGDCAETIEDCKPETIANKLKILLQMSIVLVHAGNRPVIRIGRMAGQYAKPRSKGTELRDGVELPSYFGDLVNGREFNAEARRPDPKLLLSGYYHSALTLNFIRSLTTAGFADMHHPEYWDLSFMSREDLPAQIRREYESSTRQLAEAIRFVETIGGTVHRDLFGVDFFTSHEGLHLRYEAAQTRCVPHRAGFYDLTCHLPWIGERTRALSGAHVEFFRGIRNPVGVKVGASASPDDVVRLVQRLNPDNEPGKIVLIARLGAGKVYDVLPSLIAGVRSAGLRVLWASDPMHGNTETTASGIKTRNFERILAEIERSFDVHAACGSILGGVHFELTGDDVTECVGRGVTEADLDTCYRTACDPRLNVQQALEMALLLGRRLARGRAKVSCGE